MLGMRGGMANEPTEPTAEARLFNQQLKAHCQERLLELPAAGNSKGPSGRSWPLRDSTAP